MSVYYRKEEIKRYLSIKRGLIVELCMLKFPDMISRDSHIDREDLVNATSDQNV